MINISTNLEGQDQILMGGASLNPHWHNSCVSVWQAAHVCLHPDVVVVIVQGFDVHGDEEGYCIKMQDAGISSTEGCARGKGSQ